jgi:hypothetical protein
MSLPLRSCRIAVVVGILASVARVAHAAELSVRGPAECVDAEELSFRIERSIGMALGAAAPLRFEVEMERSEAGHRARIEVRMAGSPDVAMQRSLTADNCDKLASAVSVAIGLALGAREPSLASADSERAVLPAADAEAHAGGGAASGAATRSREPSDASTDAPTHEAGWAPKPALSLWTLADVGSLPSPALGVALGAEVSFRRFALRALGTLLLEQQAHVAGAAAAGPGAKLELMTGALLGCVGPFGDARAALAPLACLGVELGRLTGSGTGVSFPRSGSALWAAPVAQLGAVWSIPQTSLQLSSALLAAAPLNRDQFALGGIGSVHQPPPLVGRWSLGVGVLFD